MTWLLMGLIIAALVVAGEVMSWCLNQTWPSDFVLLVPHLSALLGSFLLALWRPSVRACAAFAAIYLFYGAIAHAAQLEFHYHDFPNTFLEYLPVLLVRTAIDSTCVLLGYGAARVFSATRRRLRRSVTNQE